MISETSQSVVSHATHGGADALGKPAFDFSTNSNSMGPCPSALEAVLQADRATYPDPDYTHLRKSIANFHGVDAQQVVVGGSGSELIARISGWASRSEIANVRVPEHAYGDYARAALQNGLKLLAEPECCDDARLIWHAAPTSPLGSMDALPPAAPRDRCVLDLAYWPLRLDAEPGSQAPSLEAAWQLWSPNKALGMTGVRGAYLVVPERDQPIAQALRFMAPSWCVGADGVAMLLAWAQPAAQQWITNSLEILRERMHELSLLLERCNWQMHSRASVTSFLCAKPAYVLSTSDVKTLRDYGIKLRDATSFGLPLWWRLSAQPQPALDALEVALKQLNQVHQESAS